MQKFIIFDWFLRFFTRKSHFSCHLYTSLATNKRPVSQQINGKVATLQEKTQK